MLLRGERDGKASGIPQVRRQVADEHLSGGHRRHVPVYHEPVKVQRQQDELARATSFRQKSTLCHKVEFLGQGVLGLDELVAAKVEIGARDPPNSLDSMDNALNHSPVPS